MKIHYSALDAYLSCPYAYKQRYILGIRDTEESSALHFGTALHAAIRAHFDGGDALEVFTLYWDSLKDVKMKYYRHDWQQLRDLVTNSFLRNFIRLHASKFTDVKMEELLEAPLFYDDVHDNGEIIIEGTFDMCSQYDNVLTMTDWKTSGSVYKEDKIIKNPQLYLYSHMYRHKYGQLPKQIQYKTFVKYNGSIQTLKKELTEENLSRQLENSIAIVKMMLNSKAHDLYPHTFSCYCNLEEKK